MNLKFVFVVDQMLQLNVIPLSLMFTLASCLQGERHPESKVLFQLDTEGGLQSCLFFFALKTDQGWKLNVSKSITVEKGSNVTIHCLFSYPEKHHTPDVKVYWKTAGTSVCAKTDNDKAAFVFHPNQTCVLPEFTGRTRLIGNENSGNCSLQILNITKEQSMYVRIIAKGDQYSFKKERVIISLKGENLSQT